MASHALLYFFVIVTLVYFASADGDGGYKLLDYGEELPAHPRQNIVQRAQTPRIQRREEYDDMVPDLRPRYEPDPNRTEYKRKSSFEETNKYNNFLKQSGLKVIYGRMPLPVILVSSYPKPKH